LSDSTGSRVTYGGYRAILKPFAPVFRLVDPSINNSINIDTFNMNLVVFDRNIISDFGFLRPGFSHGMADFDFGVRLNKADQVIKLLPGYYGITERNSFINTSRDKRYSLQKRLKLIFSIKEAPFHSLLIYTDNYSLILRLPIFFLFYGKKIFLSLFFSR
jgi:GT2 family glycosyltransferase